MILFGKATRKDLHELQKSIEDAQVVIIRRISDLELEIEKLKTHINSLRGLINRKKSEILDSQEKKETFKYDDGLDSLR